MSDIARAAGCSRAAVTNVLTGAGKGSIRVGPDKAKLIRKIAKQLNFQPNYAAQLLKGKSSQTVGLISNEWSESIDLRTLYWVQHFATKSGYQLLTARCTNAEETQHAVRQFRRRGIDGALVFMQRSGVPDAATQEALTELPYLVSLFGCVGISGCKSIEVDEADGVRQAVEHLVARGRKKIALLLAADSTAARRRQREEGFTTTLERLRIPFATDQICADITGWGWELPRHSDKVDKMVDRLVVRGGADAIIAYDDFSAAFLLQAFSRRNLRTPQDVALVGFENDMISHYLNPPLTTINLPVKRIAEAAIAMVVAATQQADARRLRFRTFKPSLVVRETS